MEARKLFSRPISFHACLVDITGSITSALMLSQSLYWTDNDVVQKRGGWFYKTNTDWQAETRMSRSEIEGARRRLRDITDNEGNRLWHEELRGLPAVLYYRVDLDVLSRIAFGTQTSLQVSDHKFAENLQTRCDDSCNQYTETTTKTTTVDPITNVIGYVDKSQRIDSLFPEETQQFQQAELPKPVKPRKPKKENTVSWQWITLLADTMCVDAKVNAARLGKEAKKLIEAGYTVDDVKYLAEKIWPNDYRSAQGTKLNEYFINMHILQAKQEREANLLAKYKRRQVFDDPEGNKVVCYLDDKTGKFHPVPPEILEKLNEQRRK